MDLLAKLVLLVNQVLLVNLDLPENRAQLVSLALLGNLALLVNLGRLVNLDLLENRALMVNLAPENLALENLIPVNGLYW